jgi:hypothetical protein
MAYRGFFNVTPFVAEMFLLADERGAGVATLVAKATYTLKGSALDLAEEPSPLHPSPVYAGEPGTSSLRYESDAVFVKTAADVVLLGHAQAERGRPAELDVSLRVGRAIDRKVRVFGDRVWTKTLGRVAASAPLPFERVPLVFERAFGGWDRSGEPAEHAFEPRNPVGTGFLRPGSPRDPEGVKLPNLEDPAALLKAPADQPAPVGFGFLAPDWSPRRELAGTYDEAWTKTRLPLLPADFKRAHFNAAPAALQVRGFLRGGERVEAQGVSSRGVLRFELPATRLEAVIRLGGSDRRAAPMTIDTLLIDADRHRVEIVHRASLPIHRRGHDLDWAKVQLLAEGAPHGARAG